PSTTLFRSGRAMTISMTYPVGAAALAAVFLGEPVTLPVAAGTLLTLGGIVLIVAPWAARAPDERFWFGVGAATLAALAWAVSVVLLRAPLREMEAMTAQAIRLPLAALALWATPWARAAAGSLRRIGGAALARATSFWGRPRRGPPRPPPKTRTVAARGAGACAGGATWASPRAARPRGSTRGIARGSCCGAGSAWPPRPRSTRACW